MFTKLKSLWLTQTVQLIENTSGRFSDASINRHVKIHSTSTQHRIMLRAELIAQTNGLLKAQHNVINAFKLILFILIVLSMVTGCFLALGALSQNPINLYWALFSLLGIHIISLVIWISFLLFSSDPSNSFLIQIWTWASKKLSKKKEIEQIIPAFVSLSGSQIRWLIGLIVNFSWTIILSSALFLLIILLSTKNYSFEWKTTLLSSENIIFITHFLGKLPSLIGFSMPNDDIIRLSQQAISDAEVRTAWAIWLLGIFILYGILLRFLLMLVCLIKWWLFCRTVTLDTGAPEYQQLINELQSPITQIIDYDTVGNSIQWDAHSHPKHNRLNSVSELAFLVAVDIEESWQPPNPFLFLGFVNTSTQRETVLNYLATAGAKKILIAVDTDRTPDRGITNLIYQLMENADESRVWLINKGKQIHNRDAAPFKFATPTWLRQDELTC